MQVKGPFNARAYLERCFGTDVYAAAVQHSIFLRASHWQPTPNVLPLAVQGPCALDGSVPQLQDRVRTALAAALATSDSMHLGLLPMPQQNATVIQMLYQLVKDVDELFSATNITYNIDGGSLLGVMRHGGIVPHDDDVDIMIPKRDGK